MRGHGNVAGRASRTTSLAQMSEILDAVRSGASPESLASTPMPTSTRAVFVRRDEVDMFAGLASKDKDPRRSLHVDEVAAARARPRRGLRRGHGLVDQLQHGVDQHLRAAADLRLPRPTGQGVVLGAASRARLPRRRLGRLRGGAARRLGGAQLEGRRRGHRPLQLRRRPGPERPRRLDAGRQPADLGLRDELRRTRRHLRGEGQPADAQARPT